MKLEEAADKIMDFLDSHDYYRDFEEFDKLCCEVMSDEQSYFHWDVDGDTFSLRHAFELVLDQTKEDNAKGKLIVDYCVSYARGGHLFIFVEYNKK